MRYLFGIIIIIPFILFSCKKCDDKNSIVITKYTIDESLVNKEKKYILNSPKEAYDSIGADIRSGFISFVFDLNNVSILYQYADAEGKGIYVNNYVTRDDANKKYIYTTCIKINRSPTGKKLAYNNQAVVVPKLPADYTVEFVIKK